MLRTVGQDLDEAQAETSSIEGDIHWLTISWHGPQGERTREYTAAEISEANRRRATARRPDA
jgi:hypothetical protein